MQANREIRFLSVLHELAIESRISYSHVTDAVFGVKAASPFEQFLFHPHAMVRNR